MYLFNLRIANHILIKKLINKEIKIYAEICEIVTLMLDLYIGEKSILLVLLVGETIECLHLLFTGKCGLLLLHVGCSKCTTEMNLFLNSVRSY